jgi:hypothetical protein
MQSQLDGMRKSIDEPSGSRTSGEYLWFAMTLIVLLICIAAKNVEEGTIADSPFKVLHLEGTKH